MRRRGVTLLELLLVLALLGIVGSMVTAMVTAASRMGARAATQLAAERTTQVAATFFRHALAAATWPDVAVAVDSVALLRPVGEGAVCAANGMELWIRQVDWTGERAPDPARDQLVVWPLGSIGPVREAMVGVVGSSCPDGAAAWRVTRGAGGAIGAWVRVESPATVRRYRVGSAEWLGLVEGGATVQPFAGPLVVGASRFAAIGEVLQLDLVTPGGNRAIPIPLRAGP